MPGRALEIALTTGDIHSSFEFWTRLGHTAAATGDTWSHPYGVVAARGLNLGLHDAPLDGPVVTLVRPEVAGLVPLLEERGVTPEGLRLGSEVFNELRFSDPAGLPIRVLEARTFSPARGVGDSLFGRFEALSWPAADADAVASFWRRLHVEPEATGDWAELRADVGGQALAWHAPRLAREPLLVFRHPDAAALRATLAAQGLAPQARGLAFGAPHLTLVSPEGLRILILA
jgi:hypothetical protein